MKKRVHVYYSGMVQGVGFRFTAERIARTLGVSGWVKNLADGRVELVSEADERTLADFLGRIKDSSLRDYIQDTQISWSEAADEFNGFKIAF
jgi:acylphosphatase